MCDVTFNYVIQTPINQCIFNIEVFTASALRKHTCYIAVALLLNHDSRMVV